jgi:D-sedoheptulose 7-phosphate isomerase
MNFQSILQEHIDVAQASFALLADLQRIAELSSARLKAGGKVLFCGNGGSAADAQHFAAELIGRFYLERKAIAAIALTTDTSILTCLGNDYSYDIIFSRQLEALCTDKDVVVLLSTSGNSSNILRAAEVAKSKGAYSIGFTGKDGGALKTAVDDCLVVPSNNTPRIQEMHLLLGHTYCEYIEKNLSDE